MIKLLFLFRVLIIINEMFNPGKLMATSATFFNSLQLTTGYSKAQIDKCPEPISFGKAFPLKGSFVVITMALKAMVITTTYSLIKVVIS